MKRMDYMLGTWVSNDKFGRIN